MEEMYMTDTICAISTSLGVGAISIIRVSGTDAIRVVNSIFKGKDLTKVESHTINYGHIVYNNEIIDEVLVSVMKSPKTFTMEDVVEINSHGGISTTNKVLEVLLLSGARLAEPGEFTKRAFLNGRIDLVNAEAVGDLITAKTEKSRKLAINQLTGNVSNLIKNIRSEILDIIANMEVNIDYPEYEEGEDYSVSRFLEKIILIKDKLDKLMANSMDGKIVKMGINVALLGKPNVGKSSILNKFLDEEKAIVTNIPGTTRDIVEGNFTLRGIEINVIDTAGIRETFDIVEKLGVEKSLKISENADLIIYVLDGTNKITDEDFDILKKLKNKKVIIFINKSDMNINIDKNVLKDFDVIIGNTKKDNGLDDLKEEIIKLFNIDELEQSDYTFLSNARDISLIKKSSEILNNIPLNINMLPIDIFIIDLRKIYDLLGELIGETYKDDLLDEMFSKFCLGK
jgi:tRNA modification GTPase